MQMSAFPAMFECPVHGAEDGATTYTKEEARIEIALATPGNPGGKNSPAKVEVTIWAESGQHKLHFLPQAGLAAGRTILRMLANLYPDMVDDRTGDDAKAAE